MPVFDDLASMAHESTLGIFGEPIVFVASDNRYSPQTVFGVVTNKQVDFDEFGTKIINEAVAVKVNVLNQDFRIDDEVTFLESGLKYRIIDEIKDVNVTSKFVLQEL